MQLLLLLLAQLVSCSSYSPPKKVDVPFSKGTSFKVSQGPFGKASHSEKGNEFSWDFDVPYVTSVLEIEDGEVLQVWEPQKGGGCEAKYSDSAHNIKIEHADGSVSQYVHVESLVKEGSRVRRGDVIARTSMNGFICSPQLHFGVYKSKEHLYSSPKRQTLPIYFNRFYNGSLSEGKTYRVK